MKKNLLILIILSVVLYSCGNSFGGFDPRAYNSKPNLDTDIPDEDEIEPPPVPDGDDPFKESGNINPDEIFDDDKFNSWSFRVTGINGDNVPSYKFESDRTWTPLDAFKGEYSHGGGKIGSGIKEINGVTYYRYKSKNPIFKPDSSYNMGHHGERMERFYFYRFTGGAAMNTKLDNYVIAVDTYKKLVFAYAVPIRSYNPGMGFPNVPTAWGSVDSHTKHDGETRPFYEYDPVGYVTEDGSVTVYPWFYSILSKDKYDPIINGEYTANASSAGPGKSPYFVTYEAGERDPFREAFRNKTYSLRYTDNNYGVDTLTLHSYEFSYDGNELTYKTEEWFNGTSTTVITFGTYEKVDANTAKYGDITFKVDGNNLFKDSKHIGILNYNQDPIFLDRVKGANFGNGSSWKFTENGRHVVINGSSYQYEKSRDGRTALYGWENGIGIWYFYSVKLYDESGKKDHKIMRGSSGGGSGIPMWDVIMTDAGYRITAPPPPAEDLFLTSVANKTYYLRDATQTTVLHKYKFSGDGKTVTYNTRVWGESGDRFIKDYTGYTVGNMTTTGNYDGTPFEIRGNDLYKNSVHVGTYNYNDPGVDELIVTVTAKKLSNINWSSYIWYLDWFTWKKNYRNFGSFTYAIGAAVYPQNGTRNHSTLANYGNGDQAGGGKATKNITKGSHIDLSGSTSGTYYGNKSNIIIELDSKIRQHHFDGGAWPAVTTFESEMSAQYGKPIVTLKYDKNTEKITVVGVTGGGVSAVYDQNFTVSKGEAKDFTITYGTGDKQTSVTYNIKVDEK